MLRQNANRQRAARKKIRVIFPDCTVICHKKVTLTMVDTLRHIGVERFTDIDLMVGDQRWVTTEVPQRYKDWNEPIADGWFLITQSTTEQKFMQLKAINIKLNLDLKIEIGENLETDDAMARTNKAGGGKKNSRLAVMFPDGYVMRGTSLTRSGQYAPLAHQWIVPCRRTGVLVLSHNQWRDVDLHSSDNLLCRH